MSRRFKAPLGIILACSIPILGQQQSPCDRLIQAAKEGRTEAVVKFLDQGVEIDCRGVGQYTALITAAKAGQIEVVKLLCSRKADINARTEFGLPEEGYTALLWAIKNQEALVVEVLLENGADANIPDGWGVSPLMYAAWRKNLAFVKSLIAHGADTSYRKPVDGRPVLFDAMSARNLPMVEVMVAHGADPKAQDSDGHNLLMEAASVSFLDGVKYCVDKGIQVNDRSKYGETAVRCVAGSDSVEGSAVLRFLIERRGDISTRDSLGRTPLMAAASFGAQEATKILIDSGAKVDDRDDRGETPLHLAARGQGAEKSAESVEILLARGAEIEARDKEGLTPLLSASKFGKALTLKELVLHKANVNAQDNRGWTGLMYAASDNQIKVLTILLENGANLDIKNNFDQTALMIAEKWPRTREAYDLLKNFAKRQSTSS